MDVVTYILARKYTDNTVDGLGAIKGAPCTVKSIVDIDGGKRITLEWEGMSGTKQTQSFDIKDGVDGRSITSIEVNAEEHLIIHYSDGTSEDAGVIDVHSAVESVNGKTGVVNLTASDVGALSDNTPIPTKTSDLDNDSSFVNQNYVDTGLAAKADISDLNNYVEKENNKSLMSADEHTKLDGIENGAQKNVQSDWNQGDSTKADFIKNKPTIPSPVTVDDELSDSSINPVQNKVVKAAIDEKANTSALNNYVEKIAGKGLSTEDYTTVEKEKLSGVASHAERNTIVSITVNGIPVQPDAERNVNIVASSPVAGTQSDWNEDDTTDPAYIKNKPDLSQFITSTVDNLVNYYKKSETYSQSEIDALVASVSSLHIEVVSELPTDNISTMTIYLVPSADPQSQNIKDEYVNINGTSEGWEKIGTTDIDLSQYVSRTELNTTLNGYVQKNGTDRLMTAAEGTKLSGIAEGAEVNTIVSITVNGAAVTPDANRNVNIVAGGGGATVQSDWEQTDDTAADYVKNKPAIKDTGGYSKNTVMVNFLSGDFASTVDQSVSACVVEGYKHNVTHNAYVTHVEGGYNIVYDGTDNHAEGSGNQLGDPDNNTSTHDSHIEGSSNKILKGNQNHAEGIGNVISGNECHVEGEANTITEQSETIHVEGSGNTASGAYGHAEGRVNTLSGTAAHVEGMNSTASGVSSHAEGEFTVASGKDSHSGGLRAQATSNQTFAHGNTVTASNKFGTAFGISNYEKIAADDNDNTYTLFSIGNGTIKQVDDGWIKDAASNAFEVRKNGTVIEGAGSTANGVAAHAEGGSSHANGNYSHAEGNGTTASALDAHSEGAWSTASGVASHVEGDSSRAAGYASHAEGKEVVATGDESHAGGRSSNAVGERSFVHGYKLQASNKDEAVFGQANSEVTSVAAPTAYTIFAIGNGTVSNDAVVTRSNAFEVRSNGDVYSGNNKFLTDADAAPLTNEQLNNLLGIIL